MKLKLSFVRLGDTSSDLVVTVEPTAPVHAVAEALATRDPQRSSREERVDREVGLRVHLADGGTVVPPRDASLAEVSLRSGSAVGLTQGVDGWHDRRRTAVATLRVLAGPDAGKEFPLPRGSSTIGRSRASDVRLVDPLVSKTHARVVVGDTVEVIDAGSANGILVDDDLVDRFALGRDHTAVLGDTSISVVLHLAGSDDGSGSPVLEFNRSPRLMERYSGTAHVPPEAPTPPEPARMPWLTLLGPLILGVVLYAVTRSVLSMLFIALSPILGLGSYLESHLGAKRAYRRATAAYLAECGELELRIVAERAREQAVRQAENPAVCEVATACSRQSTLLWSRRREMPEYLQVRLGLGRQSSRSSVEQSRQRGVEPSLKARLDELALLAARVDDVPVVADLVAGGVVGVGGAGDGAVGVARGLVVQLVGLHSPADLAIVGLASPVSAQRWDWLKWLPHTGSAYSPLSGPPLATTAAGCAELVGALADLIDKRSGSRDEDERDPRTLVVVENDAPAVRSRMIDLAERGPANGVHVLWVAPTVELLPSACTAFVDIPADEAAKAVLVDAGQAIAPLAVEPLSVEEATALARRLAPVVDVGALVDDDSDLPTTITTLALVGVELGDSPAAVIERWAETGSLPILETEPVVTRRKPLSLRAVVGQAAAAPLTLDLRTQGPHALVGGTTGSGKSEFLQTWVLAMAATYSPARVTFLFVDYKGGSAFKDCVLLPHSVGMVTDLSPALVRRALTSLRAELTYRERLLQQHGLKDLAAMENAGLPGCPPSLVLVVDEFAALVKEVPEFVDGVVDIAQRGRSLGLHMILATQRPAGVIKDNLRANTNLRIALRMADEEDSTDVLGVPLAAGFDLELPGRAAAKTGPGRITVFQSAFSGGRTRAEAPPPDVLVEELRFGPTPRWESLSPPDEPVHGPTDMARMVARMQEATRQLGMEPPRIPWLPVLAAAYDLEDERFAEALGSGRLVVGVADVPEGQEQPVIAFDPDQDGNLAVFGTGGSGKSAALRTLAVSAGLSIQREHWQLYALDFAGGALATLEELPHVGSVIAADDAERVVRLIRQLEQVIDDRASRWAAVRAGSLDSYRELADIPDEARVLLLVDGLAAFRQEHEFAARGTTWERFVAIVAEGRQLGVHVAVTADRPATLASSIGSGIQRRLVLRLADENDYEMLGVPADVLQPDASPGRGLLDGHEVQVAVPGGVPSVVAQAGVIARIADDMRAGGAPSAPSVGRLPARVPLSALPDSVGGLPVIGVSDADLEPLAFDPRGAFLVSGPPRSGRTTALATLALSVRRWRANTRLVYLGHDRSPLVTTVPWDAVATDADSIAALAKDLLAGLEDERVPLHYVVIERPVDVSGTTAEMHVATLIGALRRNGHGVVGDGEASDLTGFQEPLLSLRADRTGVALQPNSIEGDSLFQVPFGNATRAEFPPGRGFYVARGIAARAQLAVPE